MAFRIAGSASSIVASMVYALGFMRNDTVESTPPPLLVGNPTSSVSFEWSTNDMFPKGSLPKDRMACQWWSPDVGRDTTHDCSGGSLRAALGSGVADALRTADKCARAAGVHCILSAEVGLELPAVFIWDMKSDSMRAILAPRRQMQYESTQIKSRVRVGHPLDPSAVAGDVHAKEFVMSKSVQVEYVDGRSGSVKMVHATFNESDAYCVQLLDQSVSEECAADLWL
jgi:hypothetical protein